MTLSATWGGSFVLLRVASPAFGPWALGGTRCVLAAAVLALLLRWRRERWPPLRDWPQLAAVSVLTVAAPFVLFPLAALALPAGYSAVLNTTAPFFSMLGAAALGEERLTVRRLLGCAIGFAGVMLLMRLGPVTPTPQVLLAALACTAAAATYGVGAILMKRAALRHTPLSASAAVHVSAGLMLLVPAGLAAPAMRPTTTAVLALLFLGLVTSGFMYWLSMRLMREISASASTSSAFMIPLFGVLWGGLFLGEPVTAGMIPGCLLVLAATALITGFNPFRAAPPEP